MLKRISTTTFIVAILFSISFASFKVVVNDEGTTECYAIWNDEKETGRDDGGYVCSCKVRYRGVEDWPTKCPTGEPER